MQRSVLGVGSALRAVREGRGLSLEEAARDLGANAQTTFREVTLPLVWTGIFGSFL